MNALKVALIGAGVRVRARFGQYMKNGILETASARLARIFFVAMLGFALAPQSFADTSVKLMGASTDQADLMMNGWVMRRMRAGQTSPEGVKLISAAKDTAEVEVNGKRYTLRVGQVSGGTVTLQADSQGHFFTTIEINGFPTRAIVDTGASSVVINSAEAQRMGIHYANGDRITTQTANGETVARRVTFKSVRLGDIVVENVQGLVVEGGAEKLRDTLLGMTFLSRVDLERRGSTMSLTQR